MMERWGCDSCQDHAQNWDSPNKPLSLMMMSQWVSWTADRDWRGREKLWEAAAVAVAAADKPVEADQLTVVDVVAAVVVVAASAAVGSVAYFCYYYLVAQDSSR